MALILTYFFLNTDLPIEYKPTIPQMVYQLKNIFAIFLLYKKYFQNCTIWSNMAFVRGLVAMLETFN